MFCHFYKSKVEFPTMCQKCFLAFQRGFENAIWGKFRTCNSCWLFLGPPEANTKTCEVMKKTIEQFTEITDLYLFQNVKNVARKTINWWCLIVHYFFSDYDLTWPTFKDPQSVLFNISSSSLQERKVREPSRLLSSRRERGFANMRENSFVKKMCM